MHHLLEHDGFGERETYHGHHEGEGCAEAYSFGNKHFDNRYDASGIGVHRYGRDDGKRNGIPMLAAKVFLEETLRHIAVN